MSTKDLLEIIIGIIGGGGAIATGAFAFAMNKYNVELLKHSNNLGTLQLEIKNQNFESGRKLQKNIDSIIVEIGVLKCDVRDIKAVLTNQGTLHDRAGFPEDNIPRRTDWNNIEDA